MSKRITCDELVSTGFVNKVIKAESETRGFRGLFEECFG